MEEEKIISYLKKRSGKRMNIVGIVMLALAILTLVIGVIILFFTDTSDPMWDSGSFYRNLLIIGLMTFVFFIIGLPMLIIGRIRKSKF